MATARQVNVGSITAETRRSARAANRSVRSRRVAGVSMRYKRRRRGAAAMNTARRQRMVRNRRRQSASRNSNAQYVLTRQHAYAEYKRRRRCVRRKQAAVAAQAGRCASQCAVKVPQARHNRVATRCRQRQRAARKMVGNRTRNAVTEWCVKPKKMARCAFRQNQTPRGLLRVTAMPRRGRRTRYATRRMFVQCRSHGNAKASSRRQQTVRGYVLRGKVTLVQRQHVLVAKVRRI